LALPQPIYALSLFLHLTATALWIGGLLLTLLLVWPALRHSLADAPTLQRALNRWRRRFLLISGLSLAVLVTTGMFQMSSDPNYDGVMQISNTWSAILLLKHVLVVAMAVILLVLQFALIPALDRAALLAARRESETDAYARLHRREVWLTWLNAGLGVVVVLLSVLAATL
jgi:uncharacterized membrane protein